VWGQCCEKLLINASNRGERAGRVHRPQNSLRSPDSSGSSSRSSSSDLPWSIPLLASASSAAACAALLADFLLAPAPPPACRKNLVKIWDCWYLRRQTHPDDPQQKVDEGEEGGGWGSRERPAEAASPNNVRRALEQQAGACWGRWSPWTSGKFARATHVGALDAPLKVPCPACPWAHPLALLP